ncbi:tryptophan synthase subunit beta, partial [mine drainage metagenome]
TEEVGGARIYLKREDLNHTGAHKINNTLGQALLCKRMGKRRLIAETGAGQHGVPPRRRRRCLVSNARCSWAASTSTARRSTSTAWSFWGAKVRPVESGSGTLKDATNAALRDWVSTVRHTHYGIGSVVGPHPFPTIVRTFQSVIGLETLAQTQNLFGRAPDAAVACVGG